MWLISSDCPPELLYEYIWGASAKNPHVLTIFVDNAPKEHSIAHEYLCYLADNRQKKAEWQ